MNKTEEITLKTDKLSLEALKAIEEAPDRVDFIERAIEYYVKTNVSSQLEEILEAVRQLDQKVSSRSISLDESDSDSSKLASKLEVASESASTLTAADNKYNQTSEEDLTDLLLEGFDNF